STIVELRDTIWAMNSQAIRFEDLRARILNFIEKAKEAKEEIEFGFTIDDDLNQMELDSVSGMNIYRTIQEAVNNAMKYSGAKQIAIEVKADGNQIRISIRDNGIGFDPKNTEAGNGLTNMEKRMGDIGWTYKLESETGKGTTITLLHKSNENHAS
ncbi:MAG TPA: ATP-binding protein, partial [Flavobacterium sp.]|nr:ATP-binding protein [Flavobacterium sp.]